LPDKLLVKQGKEHAMKKNISIKTAAIVVILASLIGFAVAAVLFERHITNTVNFIGGNFRLVSSDDLEVDVTSINNPQILIGFASLSMSAAIISLV
jgi:hypothetical protein